MPDSSKIRRTARCAQTIAIRESGCSLRLTTTSTPSAVESMKVVSERSRRSWSRPSCSDSSSIHFRRGAVERSSSPSTEITFVRPSSSRHAIANSGESGSCKLDGSTLLRMVLLPSKTPTVGPGSSALSPRGVRSPVRTGADSAPAPRALSALWLIERVSMGKRTQRYAQSRPAALAQARARARVRCSRMGELGPLIPDDSPRPSRAWRRVRGIAAVVMAFALITLLSPLLFLCAATVDLALWLRRRKPWMAVRLLALLWWFLLGELYGLIGLLGRSEEH